MESIINYINNFFYKDEDLNILESINFENMNNRDILSLLNNIKHSKTREEIYNIKLYYENIYNKDPFNNLSKLKYKLLLYLDFEKDKTENILNEINKYKDPELDKLEKRFIKLKQDIDYTLFENRYMLPILYPPSGCNLKFALPDCLYISGSRVIESIQLLLLEYEKVIFLGVIKNITNTMTVMIASNMTQTLMGAFLKWSQMFFAVFLSLCFNTLSP